MCQFLWDDLQVWRQSKVSVDSVYVFLYWCHCQILQFVLLDWCLFYLKHCHYCQSFILVTRYILGAQKGSRAVPRNKILLVFSGSHIHLLYGLLNSDVWKWEKDYFFAPFLFRLTTQKAFPFWLQLGKMFCFWSQKRSIFGVANVEFCQILKVCNYLTNYADVLKFCPHIVNLVTITKHHIWFIRLPFRIHNGNLNSAKLFILVQTPQFLQEVNIVSLVLIFT